jgi:hypothetical protein
MRGGTVVGELPAEGASEEDVLRLASVGGGDNGDRPDDVKTEETEA